MVELVSASALRTWGYPILLRYFRMNIGNGSSITQLANWMICAELRVKKSENPASGNRRIIHRSDDRTLYLFNLPIGAGITFSRTIFFFKCLDKLSKISFGLALKNSRLRITAILSASVLISRSPRRYTRFAPSFNSVILYCSKNGIYAAKLIRFNANTNHLLYL